MKPIDKLLQYDFVDGSFVSFKLLEYHRDVEIIAYTKFEIQKLKITLKGVISLNHKTQIKEGFSLDKKYLDKKLLPPYKAYHWGIRSFEISNITIRENSKNLLLLEKVYDFKLYKILFNINTSLIEIVFNDLEIEELNL